MEKLEGAIFVVVVVAVVLFLKYQSTSVVCENSAVLTFQTTLEVER